jgi:hypothetical protein
MGGARLTGGSPRYQLYPTRTASSSAARRWSRSSGSVHRDDRARAGVRRRPPRSGGDQGGGRRHHRGRSAEEWRPVFAAADCCVTIMATLEEALRDPHFVERGLFAHRSRADRRDHAGAAGADRSAVPRDARSVKAVPKLSVNEGEVDAEHQHPGERTGNGTPRAE